MNSDSESTYSQDPTSPLNHSTVSPASHGKVSPTQSTLSNPPGDGVSNQHCPEDGVVSQQKQLGVFDGAKFLVSYVVGAGIFATVNDVHENIGNMWVTLAVWIACGALCLIGALCYAELACMLPGSGGEHIYMRHGYGVVGMRLFDWMSFAMLRPASYAYYAFKFAVYFVRLIGPNHSMTWWEEITYPSVFIILITLFSIMAPKLFDKAQSFFTYTKIAGLFSVVIFGLVVLIYNPAILKANALLQTPVSQTPFKGPAMAICFAILTFDGWNAINPIAGRFKNPIKTIPKAISYGTSSIIIIFLSIIVSYFFIQTDFSGTANRTIFESITDALWNKRLIGTYIGNLIICVAIFSATQAGISSSVDIFESAVEDGSLPGWMMNKSIFGTHYVMFSLQALLTILYIVASVGMQELFGVAGESFSSDHATQISTLPFCIFYLLSVVVIIMNMFKKQKTPNPGYKTFKAFPFIFVLATLGLIGILVGFDIKDGIKKKDPNAACLIRNAIVFFSIAFCIIVAFFKDAPKKGPKSEKAQVQPQVDGESEEVNLETTASIPPTLVESAFLGTAKVSQ